LKHLSIASRRCALICCLLILFCACIGSVSPAHQAADWLMFRGSPSLNGVTAAVLPETLKLRWSFQAKDSIESSAAIAGGAVFFGSMDASLYAVNLATGKLIWRYATANPIQESSPCVCNNSVYVGDLNGVLHAVDAATGKVRWTFKAEGEIKSSPNCYMDRIYVGSYDQNLYCLSAKTGALLWKFSTEGPIHCTPAIEKDRVHISGCDETFRAIDATTGKQLYSLQLGAYMGASVAIVDNHAYVGTFGNEVLSLNLQQRSIEWVYRHPTRSFPYYSSAAVANDRVVLGGRDKIVHCLHRLSGKEIWSFTTRARVESSPLVTGNRVFIGSNDGLLYELDFVSGKKVWDFTAGSPVSASPAAAQGFLVIGSQDGMLYCFGE
jgi:eukaryotic-like serine/threonine-protein kinase